jgi:uncharacterized protein YjbI with pentapeptide repeats
MQQEENTMKKFFAIILAFMFFSVSAFAQSRVNARDILNSIDSGKAVSYKGVEIVGDLDLTTIQDKEADKNNRRSRNSTDVFWYHVRSPLSFVDCTFKDDVIAYYHDEDKNETHNAVFHADVSFQGCEFQGESAFKYSKFYEGSDFTKTTYAKEALFKYTEFSTDVSFAGSTFSNDANFKYTKFPQKADFSDADFQDVANFKYTKFPDGVSFKNAVFQGDADFKYAKFYEPFDFEGTEFEDSVDFKYTKLEGKSFTKYLLKNRK